MDTWHLLMEILVLLGAAFALGTIAQKLKQSAIIGYLLAGAVLGPLLFNKEAILNVSELGVALLLFSIGLEFSFRRLKSLGAIAIVGGWLQVIVTLLLFAFILSFMLPTNEAIVLGAIAALSSTAVVLRVLADRTEIDSTRGRNALGILLMQDMAVVPLILLVSIFSDGKSMLEISLEIGRFIVAASGLAGIFYIIFYHLIPKLLLTKDLATNHELVILLTLVIALGAIWGAHALGLSPALGGFLAGLLLADSPFASQIRADIGSIRTLFVTLFFTSIGMLADPTWFMSNWEMVLIGAAVVFIGKTVITYLITLVFKQGHQLALATGITLAQIGEFSFVLAAVARSGGLMQDDTFSLVITVAILTMFAAPYMVTYASPFANRIIAMATLRKADMPELDRQPVELNNNRIFIIGFGPAGRQVANALQKQNLTPVVIEQNPKSAEIARQKGLSVYLGDASKKEIILHAGMNRGTCAVIVTVPDPRTSRSIIESIRSLLPAATVFARNRYHIYGWELQEAGASEIVDEEKTVGSILAEKALGFLCQDNNESMACAVT